MLAIAPLRPKAGLFSHFWAAMLGCLKTFLEKSPQKIASDYPLLNHLVGSFATLDLPGYPLADLKQLTP